LWARGFEQDFATAGGWGISGSAQQANFRKQQQAGRSSRACVQCRMHEVRVK